MNQYINEPVHKYYHCLHRTVVQIRLMGHKGVTMLCIVIDTSLGFIISGCQLTSNKYNISGNFHSLLMFSVLGQN